VNLSNVNVQNCNNPTFVPNQPNVNYLAQIAPQPPDCDKAGQGPCVAGEGIVNGNPVGGKAPAGTSSGGPATGSSANAAGATASGTGSASTAASSGANTDGQSADQSVGSDANSSDTAILGTPTVIGASGGWSMLATALAVVSVLVLLAILIVPPLLSKWFGVRRRRQRGPA
jgi:hypothetical protein